jgi:CRISPR-associated protein Cas1
VRDRLLDFSDHAAHLSIERGLLSVEVGDTKATVPPGEIAAVIISHPGTTITGSALAALGASGSVVIAADRARLPAMMGVGVVGNTIQTERIRLQALAKQSLMKRLWQQIVRIKVQRQAEALRLLTGDDRGLLGLADSVRSGDPENVEAQAARRYWSALMGPGFTRDKEWSGFNATLDYGYAIVRAFVARSVVAAGLHPSLGLHHRNRYNPLCLADDLFEPFRPEVDMAVHRLWSDGGNSVVLAPRAKKILVAAVTRRRDCGGEMRRLGDVCQILSVSLVRCLAAKEKRLQFPEMLVEGPGQDEC